MLTLEIATSFFGWCTVINSALLFFAFISITLMKGFSQKAHSKIFGLNDENLARSYFQFSAQYKIIT